MMQLIASTSASDFSCLHPSIFDVILQRLGTASMVANGISNVVYASLLKSLISKKNEFLLLETSVFPTEIFVMYSKGMETEDPTSNVALELPAVIKSNKQYMCGNVNGNITTIHQFLIHVVACS